ncbi:MAG: DUF4157 domain-containing protein [Spirulinaceae cyanobacterium]
MSQSSAKAKASSWQPTTHVADKNSFTSQPFPVKAKNDQETKADHNMEGYKEPQPGAIVNNINHSLKSGSAPSGEPSPSTGRGSIQAKLTIGEPGDKYEQEADSVAAEVVQRLSNPASHAPSFEGGSSQIQRQSAIPILPQKRESTAPMPLDMAETIGQSNSEFQQPLRRKGEANVVEPQEDLESSLNQAKGGGKALDDSFRAKVEPIMGADFSGVNIHTDSRSDQLNRSIQAKAFATGQDVFFRQGEYQPGTKSGQELIAHELTHVVQQSTSAPTAIQRKPEDAVKKANTIGQDKVNQIKKEWETYRSKLTSYKDNEKNKQEYDEAVKEWRKDQTKQRPKAKEYEYSSLLKKPKKPKGLKLKEFAKYEAYEEFQKDKTSRRGLYTKEDQVLIDRLAELDTDYINEGKNEPIFTFPEVGLIETENGEKIEPKELLLNIEKVGKIQILLFETVNKESEDNVLAWMSHGIWLRDKPKVDLNKQEEDPNDKMGLSFAVKGGENLSFVDPDKVAENAGKSFGKFKDKVNEDKETDKENPYKTPQVPNMVLGAHEEWLGKEYEQRASKIVKKVIDIGSVAVLASFEASEDYKSTVSEATSGVFKNYILIDDLLEILKGDDKLKQYKNLYMLTCRTDIIGKKQSKDNSDPEKITARESPGYPEPISPNQLDYTHDNDNKN